ncbi:MAG: hypothetical protein GWM88_15210 [Pseudomonadales bacterium]|nr:hypothetical protein [Pseudomonadales bacterium]NIX09286.1 hypothetical protein [Pseudomonadales bacterium]
MKSRAWNDTEGGAAAPARLAGVLVALIALGAPVAAPTATAGPGIDARVDSAATPWTSLEANDAEEDFTFVVVADRTRGHRPGVFESGMPKVNLLQPAFVVSVGDLIEGYTDDAARLKAEWDEFEGLIEQLDVPFFYAAGNHDMSNAVMSEAWRARFGPSFYHFLYKDVLFVVVNSELFGMVTNPWVSLPGPWTQDEQMRYFERVLARHADVRWTIVLTHQPLWNVAEVHGDWLKFEALLGERPYTVFAGHEHRYQRALRHDRKYITLATTGGASPLRGALYGEFDHVAMVHMSSRGPTIANLMLDGIQPDDVTTEDSLRALRQLSDAVQVETEYLDGDLFTAGAVRYRIVNSGAHSLEATPVILGNDVLRAEAVPAAVSVPPGGETRLALNLKASPGRAFENLPPARVTWSLRSKILDRPVFVELETALLPQRRYPVDRIRRLVRLDGDLEEWQLPYAVTRQGDIASPQTDPADISFRFGLGYDDENLYLAAEVVDDSIVASPKLTALDQDALIVLVDARPDPDRSANEPLLKAMASGAMNRMAIELLTLEPERPAPVLDFLGDVRDAIESAVVRTPDGYAAELAIPGALLSRQQGREWQVVRVGIHANDFDEMERGSKSLHWQPYRFGAAPVVGTGTFTRR